MELVTLAFLSVLFLVSGVFFVNKILSMIIESEITPVQSLIYFFVFCFFIVLFFKVPANWFRIMLIIMVAGFDLFIEPIKNYINTEDNKDYYLKKIMKCDEILLNNPYDWGTLSEKARCYFKIKDYEKAIEIQEKVVVLSKKDLSEVGKLKSYEKYLHSFENTDIRCWYCGVMVPKGVDKCYSCGHSMNFAVNIINWLKKGGAKKIIIDVIALIIIFMLYNLFLSLLTEGLRFLIHLITIIIIFACIAYHIFKKD